MIGYIRSYVPELCVTEQKPADKEVDDLRLNQPFPELVDYASSFNL